MHLTQMHLQHQMMVARSSIPPTRLLRRLPRPPSQSYPSGLRGNSIATQAHQASPARPGECGPDTATVQAATLWQHQQSSRYGLPSP